MTTRDRSVVLGLALLVALAAGWFLLIAPKRSHLLELDGRLASVQQRLVSAQAVVATNEQARDGFAEDSAAIARLGKAVPVGDDMPSLLYQVQTAATRAHVDFQSIKLSAAAPGAAAAAAAAAATPAAATPTSTTSTSTTATTATAPTGTPAAATPAATAATNAAAATQAAAAALPPGAVVGTAGYPTMPFDLTFTGRFASLERFFHRLDAFTRLDGKRLLVSGRLLTVDGFTLTAGTSGFPALEASVHVTAYLQPDAAAAASAATATATAGTAAPTTTTAAATK